MNAEKGNAHLQRPSTSKESWCFNKNVEKNAILTHWNQHNIQLFTSKKIFGLIMVHHAVIKTFHIILVRHIRPSTSQSPFESAPFRLSRFIFCRRLSSR